MKIDKHLEMNLSFRSLSSDGRYSDHPQDTSHMHLAVVKTKHQS